MRARARARVRARVRVRARIRASSVLLEPRVEALKLRGRRAADVVRAVLALDGVVGGEREAEVGAVDLLLRDHLG